MPKDVKSAKTDVKATPKDAKTNDVKTSKEAPVKDAKATKDAPKKDVKAPAAKTAAPKNDAKTAKEAPAKEAKAPAKEAPKKDVKSVKEAPAKAPAKPEPKETVIEEGDPNNAQHGKFVIKRTDKDNFVFKLFASNVRVIAISADHYSSLGAVKTGIYSVINNSNSDKTPIEDQTLQKTKEEKCPKWVVYLDKKGEFRLRLYASNGHMIAQTNDGYTTKDAAKKGIAAIARASKGADIVRNDDLW